MFNAKSNPDLLKSEVLSSGALNSVFNYLNFDTSSSKFCLELLSWAIDTKSGEIVSLKKIKREDISPDSGLREISSLLALDQENFGVEEEHGGVPAAFQRDVLLLAGPGYVEQINIIR